MKTLKLIKSEFIKIFSKKSTYIFIAALVLITVGLCFISNVTFSDDYASQLGVFKEDYSYMKDELKSKNDKTSILAVKILDNEIKMISEDTDELLKGDYYTKWREEVFGEYKAARYNLFGVELLSQGYTKQDIINAVEAINESLFIGHLSTPQFVEAGNVAVFKKEQEKIRDEKYNILKNDNFIAYAKGKKVDYENLKKEYEKQLKSLEKDLKFEMQKGEKLQDRELIASLNKQIKETKFSIEEYDGIIEVYNYCVVNKVNGSSSNWIYGTLKNIAANYSSLTLEKSAVLSEEEYYNSEEYNRTKLDYATYLEGQYAMKSTQDEITTDWYAIKNNIPQVANIANRTNTKQIITSSATTSIFGIISVIVAGAMVAHEFSTGTIRFLVTRPVKRYKILFAKLITIILFTFMLFAIYFLTSVITSGCIGSFSDLTIPDLCVEEGKVVEYSFLLSMITNMLLYMVPTFLFIILAFAVSTIIPFTAAAVGIGMGGWFACYLANSMYIGSCLYGGNIHKVFSWLKYTPIPYVDISYYVEGQSSFYLDKLCGLNLNVGLGILFAYMLLMLTVAFIVFIRRDIKNQ